MWKTRSGCPNLVKVVTRYIRSKLPIFYRNILLTEIQNMSNQYKIKISLKHIFLVKYMGKYGTDEKWCPSCKEDNFVYVCVILLQWGLVGFCHFQSFLSSLCHCVLSFCLILSVFCSPFMSCFCPVLCCFLFVFNLACSWTTQGSLSPVWTDKTTVTLSVFWLAES